MGNSAALAQEFKTTISFMDVVGWERLSDEIIEDENPDRERHINYKSKESSWLSLHVDITRDRFSTMCTLEVKESTDYNIVDKKRMNVDVIKGYLDGTYGQRAL
jgi:hypothetical protein